MNDNSLLGKTRGRLSVASCLKGYSSGQSQFSEINVKLAEKTKYATHSVQRSLEMCEFR